MTTQNGGPKVRLLLTRAAAQNQRLLAVLDRHHRFGLQVFERPLMDILALTPEPADHQLIQQLDQYDHVIFISQNAVVYGLSLLTDYWPQWPIHLRWYGVGAATGQMLNSFGIDCRVPQDYSSEGLLALAELQQVAGQRVLIVRGAGGGREWLHDELQSRGAKVDYLAVYQRQWRAYPQGLLTQDEASHLLITLVYSNESLKRLVELMTWPLENSYLVVPSERIQMLAKDLGFVKVSVAMPDDSAMAEEILRIADSAGAKVLPGAD
jgi:uroporphyrinogen-III synthase